MISHWRQLFRGVLLSTLLLGSVAQAAGQEVRVGAYHFPPYAIKPESATPAGLLPELLAALNRTQSDYHFSLVPTSVTRRYSDLQSARFDLILFESPAWGWKSTPHQSADLHIEDAEVYVARQEGGRDQRYFLDLADKRFALYSGYHYGFADFNADPDYLKQHFKVSFTYSHDSNLLMVLRDRADLAVVSRSYLALYFRDHPEYRSQLLVSEREDQVYHHRALLRPQAPLDGPRLQRLLADLKDAGVLLPLLQRYQLSMHGEHTAAH